MIDKHKIEQKCNNFGYLSTKFWLKGNNTYSRQLYTAYLFGITRLRLTWERIENCLYMHNIN